MSTGIINNGKFNLFVPIQKSRNNTDGTVTISGLASDDSEDWQGEKVLPLGIDTTYFDKQGFVDYEHNRNIVIGAPTKTTITSDGLFVEAKLFKNMPEVQSILKLMDNLKNAGVDRNIGFSIEGQVNQRDAINPSIITSLTLTGLAVTTAPANKDASFEVLTKSIYKCNSEAMQAGHDINPETQTGAEALKPESLVGELTSLTYSLDQLLKCDKDKYKSIVNQMIDIMDKDKSINPMTNQLFLQVFKGLSKDDAKDLLN